MEDFGSSPVKLKNDVRKRKTTAISKCLFCNSKNGKLVKPQDAGKRTFIKAFQRRGTCGNVDTLHLSSIIDFDNCRFVDEHTDSIRWHKQCYASYCSERNIHVAVQGSSIETTSSVRTCTCSTRNADINWKMLFL